VRLLALAVVALALAAAGADSVTFDPESVDDLAEAIADARSSELQVGVVLDDPEAAAATDADLVATLTATLAHLTGGSADGLAEALEARGFGVERIDEPGSRWDPRTPFRLWLKLRRERPQLVHVHHAGEPASLRVARAAAADGVPVLITRHDLGASDADVAATPPEIRRVYQRADLIVTASRGTRERLNRTRLVHDEVVHLLRRDLHHAATKALQVRQRRMRADRDAVVEREAHRFPDRRGIAAVEAAGDVRRADVRHDLGVGAHLPGAVALAHVAVDVDSLHWP